MSNSKLLDIINSTRSNETECKYGYEMIATDLHSTIDIEELDLEFQLENIFK